MRQAKPWQRAAALALAAAAVLQIVSLAFVKPGGKK